MVRDDIDGIVVVNTTSICVPSIDALLIERLWLRRRYSEVVSVWFGMSRGYVGFEPCGNDARSEGGMKVLLLVIEMECTTIWKGDVSKTVLLRRLFSEMVLRAPL